MDLHFGTIAAASPGLGSGCTFTVELPVVRRMQATLGGPLGPPPADITTSPMHSKDSIAPFFEPDVERPDLTITHWKPLSKILVVDDSAPSRKMLCRCLPQSSVRWRVLICMYVCRRVMKSIGCACWEADDGVGCIRQNTSCVSNGEQNFDLVLVDFIMPSELLALFMHTYIHVYECHLFK